MYAHATDGNYDDQQAEMRTTNGGSDGDDDQQQIDSGSDLDKDVFFNVASFHFDGDFAVQSLSNDEEVKVKRAGVGLWNSCSCISDWRKPEE
ncbi:hypothetical protein ACOSQ3_027771 [Xanthoceras sorbifolium]